MQEGCSSRPQQVEEFLNGRSDPQELIKHLLENPDSPEMKAYESVTDKASQIHPAIGEGQSETLLYKGLREHIVQTINSLPG